MQHRSPLLHACAALRCAVPPAGDLVFVFNFSPFNDYEGLQARNFECVLRQGQLLHLHVLIYMPACTRAAHALAAGCSPAHDPPANHPHAHCPPACLRQLLCAAQLMPGAGFLPRLPGQPLSPTVPIWLHTSHFAAHPALHSTPSTSTRVH